MNPLITDYYYYYSIIYLFIYFKYFKSQAKLKRTPMTLLGFVFSAFLKRRKSSSDPHLFSLRIIFSATAHMRPCTHSVCTVPQTGTRAHCETFLLFHILLIVLSLYPAGLSCDFHCQSLVSLCPVGTFTFTGGKVILTLSPLKGVTP